VEIVDSVKNIERVLPMLDEMVTEGTVTLERLQVIAYRSSGSSERDQHTS
jgi:PII-like signaling protein